MMYIPKGLNIFCAVCSAEPTIPVDTCTCMYTVHYVLSMYTVCDVMELYKRVWPLVNLFYSMVRQAILSYVTMNIKDNNVIK
jgi:hypothetical protein